MHGILILSREEGTMFTQRLKGVIRETGFLTRLREGAGQTVGFRV